MLKKSSRCKCSNLYTFLTMPNQNVHLLWKKRFFLSETPSPNTCSYQGYLFLIKSLFSIKLCHFFLLLRTWHPRDLFHDCISNSELSVTTKKMLRKVRNLIAKLIDRIRRGKLSQGPKWKIWNVNVKCSRKNGMNFNKFKKIWWAERLS